MPLQNRVDPFGVPHAVDQRGAWFGNKGCIHNSKGEIVRSFRGERWIICTLEFGSRKRKLLQPNCYTELFFMDEATALAAGHRPCMECRRADAIRFRDLAGYRTLSELDRDLHQDRLSPRRLVPLGSLPNGAMVTDGKFAYLVCDGMARKWSFDGYGLPQAFSDDLELLTPELTCRVLREGYQPLMKFARQPA